MTTDQFESDERQRLLRQYAEIATLAGGLAHEIKNPLSTMSMLLELLEEDLDQAESQRERRMLTKVQTIQKECRHLEDILNAFLKFARVGKLSLTSTDLNEVVSEFIEFFQPEARENGIEISPHLSGDLPFVALDSSLMRQVLLNLALNAQQAMPSGGLLELQTFARDGRVYLAVIDNGQGMDENTRSRLFEVFFSTKPNGNGLGLPTVRKIVDSHRGTITCESAVGRGTRFTISLPPAS
ncbi:MAG: ATP-binding protein [Planctomycetia bacterium]|nr:ATP-binding protein [Planctomycetia bacterium]